MKRIECIDVVKNSSIKILVLYDIYRCLNVRRLQNRGNYALVLEVTVSGKRVTILSGVWSPSLYLIFNGRNLLVKILLLPDESAKHIKI